MTIPIIHYITLIIFIEADVYIDNKLINKNKDTIMQYVVREFAFIMLSIIFAHHDNEYALYSWILSHFVYWWLFDTSLNILRGKKLWYLSEKGIDRIQRPMEVVFFVKLIFFILASLYFVKPELYTINYYY